MTKRHIKKTDGVKIYELSLATLRTLFGLGILIMTAIRFFGG